MTRDQYGLAYQVGFKSTTRYLLSQGARREFALEASQAGWVKGWERRHQLRDENLVQSWVNTIALNAYRRLIRLESMSERGVVLSSSPAVGLDAIEAERILAGCRPADRFLLEQRMQGVTTHELADTLGATETAIRIRLLRARRSVRARLEQRAAHLRLASFRSMTMQQNAA